MSSMRTSNPLQTYQHLSQLVLFPHFSLDGFTPNPPVMKQPGMSSTKVLSGLKIAGIEKSAPVRLGVHHLPRRVEKKQKKNIGNETTSCRFCRSMKFLKSSKIYHSKKITIRIATTKITQSLVAGEMNPGVRNHPIILKRSI